MNDVRGMLQQEMEQEGTKKIVENPVLAKLWTPDGVHRDGQVQELPVDKEHEEFLKTTIMVD